MPLGATIIILCLAEDHLLHKSKGRDFFIELIDCYFGFYKMQES